MTRKRPQRVELEDAIDALVEEGVDALGDLGVISEQARDFLRDFALGLLELVGVDSGAVLATSEQTPKAARKRLRKPGHGEDV